MTRSLSLLLIFGVVGYLPAAEPAIRAISVRGLQIGGTTSLTIDGDDLGTSPKLLLSFPATPTLKPKNTDKKAEFDVAVPAEATPGLYHLRVQTEGGVSAPIVIGVDRLPQVPLTPKIESLPIAVHGNLSGSGTLETTFAGKANQRLTIEIEAQRLGGKLRPVLHLRDSKRIQIAWAWGVPALNGDARFEAVLPADGLYTLAMHDAEYAGPAPGQFRLKIGTFGYVDQIFPPILARETTQVELIGSSVAKASVPTTDGPYAILPWSDATMSTGPRPWVPRSSRPEFTETNASQLPQPPFGISGRLAVESEEDRFTVPVRSGEKLRFELFAERLGSPVDASLAIVNEKGGIVAQAEDGPGTLDPLLVYTIPPNVSQITVAVRDTAGQGGPRAIYRLLVDPATSEGVGDYRLSTPVTGLNLTAGGRAVVPVYVDRRGYTGPITLSAVQLPGSVKLDGLVIPAGADGTLVTVNAATVANAAISAWSGRGTNGHTADVLTNGHPLERLQPWLAAELAVAPTDRKREELLVDWKDLPTTTTISPAGKLALPVILTRLDDKAPVRLSLLTSQNPPINPANGRPDPNREIRLERAVELGAKANESTLSVLLPADLPADAYDFAIQAELLSADKRRVLATAVTPVRSLPVKMPVLVKFEAPKLDLTLAAKTLTMVEVKGTVERAAGFDGDITLSLTGQPAGVPAPASQTVKKGETKFAYKLTLPPNTAPGTATLTLSATVVPDPARANIRVKSRETTLALTVLPPPK